MTSANSENSEDTSPKEEKPKLREELVALRKEIKALKDEITKEEEKVEKKPQKPVIRKVLKCYKETGISKDIDVRKETGIIKDLDVRKETDIIKDLDVRKMVITSDNKYLITCSEIQLLKKPRVCVWSLDKILQKLEREEDILKGKIEAVDEVKILESEDGKREEAGNWLLCVDALITKLNDKDIWIVCVGSIKGDVYIWAGDIDEKSKEWNLTPTCYHKYSEGYRIQKSIFDIKIIEQEIPDDQDKDKKKKLFKIYFSSNTIGVYTKDRTMENHIKQFCLIPLGQGINFKIRDGIKFKFQERKEWILSFDIYNGKNKKFLITGSNDNKIYRWNLENGNFEDEVGHHENGITCVKISKDGSKVASGCLDNVIKVWDLNNKECLLEKYEHTKEIVSIVFQQDSKYLISASKDSKIKVWNIADKVLVRSIDLDKELKIYDEIKRQKKRLRRQQEDKEKDVEQKVKLKKSSPGLDFLRQVLLSPTDQYIFAIKKNKILILRNYGRIWHFYQQLKYIEDKFPKLYKKIYGPNLKQIAKTLDENEDSLGKLYNEIKKRLKTPHVYNKEGQKVEESPDEYNLRILGSIFVPSFVKFEPDEESQKLYIDSVRTNYNSYWYGATKIFQEIPDLKWKFKLFLTTDIGVHIKNANFIEISNFTRNFKKSTKPFIILKNRTQSQVRFLMVLDRIQTTFIPLLKAVILDVEDDRGDKDTLIFTDFKLSRKREETLKKKNGKKNKRNIEDKEGFPLNILKKPYKSIKDAEPYRKKFKKFLPIQFYYSHCIFKLDERYSVKASATIKVRKITIEMTKSLNPFKSKKKIKGDAELYEAFRNNFHSPPTPDVNIKIGKGPIAAGSKILDKYLAGLIGLDFLFTIISVLVLYRDVFLEKYLSDLLGATLLGLNIFVSALFVVVLIWILVNPVKDSYARRKLGRPGIVKN